MSEKRHEEMLLCGIDPGKEGAIAYVIKCGKRFSLYRLFNMPITKGDYDAQALYTTLLNHKVAATKELELPIKHTLEKVNVHRRSGRKAAFGFGYGYGFIKGVLGSVPILADPIRPVEWKKKFNIKKKEDAKKIARKEVTDIDRVIQEDSRLRSLRIDQAEAILIAIANYKQ